MNRLDATKIDIPRTNTKMAMRMIWGTYATVILAVAVAICLGGVAGSNPTDRTYAGLALLPYALLIVDLWAMIAAIVRRHAPTPLRVPLKTPVILAAVHVVAVTASTRFVQFDVLYELIWINERVGNYEVRWGIGAVVIGMALVSLILAGFETRLVRWVLLSEITSAAPTASAQVSEVEDMELGPEHLYEAQVLLNNLGYDVSPITGELNESTVASLKQLQTSAGLESKGRLTVKSMIELRNRWREREEESSPVRAVSEHAVRKTGSRIAGFFKRS